MKLNLNSIKMKKNQLLLVAVVALGITTTFTSCKKEEGCTDPAAENYNADAKKDDGSCTYEEPIVPAPNPSNSITVSGNITSNTHWKKNKIVYLDGRVIVEAGAELTIDPGTIIKGNVGVNTNASSLVIARGAKIHATGTATEPIIFTSAADNITQGQIASPNLDPQQSRGLWGGVIILGAAPISPASGTTEQIEGIPASVVEGNYGGANPTDNSGEFQYCSIRHGGTVIGSGNEINGLTLGGVGSGTQIDHVEVVGNVDDGIEFFGGTVNATDLVVWFQGDDAFDVDQAYAGTVTNLAYIAGADSDHGMEIDGPEGSQNATGAFTFKSGKFKGNVGEYIDFRSGARGTVEDILFFGFDAVADVEIDDAVSASNYTATNLVIQNNVFDTTGTNGATIASIAADKSGTLPNFDADFANDNSVGTTPSTGNSFNKAEFTGWSWADVDGQLSNF